MGGKFKLFLVLAFVFSLNFVSSAIVVQDNFHSTYSVGDSISLKFSLSSSQSVSGFCDSYLVCDNDKTLIDKRYVFLDDEKENFTLEFPLLEVGGCNFKVEFLDDSDLSEDFLVSDKLDINYVLNNKVFFPLETLEIFGNITKANHDLYSGIVNFKIDGLVEKTLEVENGEFYFDYEISKTAKPKNYSLQISAAEKDFLGEILNSGKVYETVEVKSKPMKIEIISSDEINPPTNFSFQVNLLNQVDDLVLGEPVIVKIFDSVNNLIYQEEINSSMNSTFEFVGTTKRGNSYLNGYYGNFFFSKPLYVNDYRAINSTLVKNSLKFTNIGNVPYEGIVKFNLENENSSEEYLVNVSLDLGESYFYLLPVNGIYNISAGENLFLNAPLTGAAILENGKITLFGYFVTFGFIIFLVVSYVFVRKKRKKHFPNEKIQEKAEPKKLIVTETKEENLEVKQKVFMIFIKSNKDIKEYEQIILSYNLKLNLVNEKLGYVLFFQKGELSPEYRIYNLSKTLIKSSLMKQDVLTIVLNRGFFEKKINLLKKFALFNKTILDLFSGKLIIGEKIMDKLKIKLPSEEKIIEVMGRKIRVYVID